MLVDSPSDSMAGFGAPGLAEGAMTTSKAPLNSAGPWAVSRVLGRTPVEVFIEIFKHLDLSTAFSLSMTSKRFAAIFAEHRASIILPIVETEFSPFTGLLQAAKAAPDDLNTPWDTWLDKRIRHKSTILCHGGSMPEGRLPRASGITCKTAVLGPSDIDNVLAVCRVVRGWESIFPQHRFHAAPLSTRSLTPPENERLRRALYVWMRYAFYFHGELPRPSSQVPLGRDQRVNQLRVLSNSDLRALQDLWITVEDVIGLKLCPSTHGVRVDAVRTSLAPPPNR